MATNQINNTFPLYRNQPFVLKFFNMIESSFQKIMNGRMIIE